MKYLFIAMIAILPTCAFAQTNFTATVTGTLSPAPGATVNANQINGGAMPTSQPCIGSDGSGKPINGTCGSGGTGNFPTVSVSGVTMTMFSNCTPTPCNIGTGGPLGIIQINTTATATAPSASNTAYVYLDSAGACHIVALNTITASGCTYASGNAFPTTDGTTPVATVGYAASAWNAPILAQPATSSAKNVNPGTGLTTSSDNGINKVIAIDTTVVPVMAGVVSSASGTVNLDLSKVDQVILLTGVTTFTSSNIQVWKRVNVQICEQGSGGYTVTWPSGWHGAGVIDTTLNHCSMQQFESFDGTTVWATGQMVSAN